MSTLNRYHKVGSLAVTKSEPITPLIRGEITLWFTKFISSHLYILSETNRHRTLPGGLPMKLIWTNPSVSGGMLVSGRGPGVQEAQLRLITLAFRSLHLSSLSGETRPRPRALGFWASDGWFKQRRSGKSARWTTMTYRWWFRNPKANHLRWC